jgi:hypothetical protein
MRKIALFTLFCFVVFSNLPAQQQTSDLGYVIIGSTFSYSNGSTDFLVYKLDASGTKMWRKNFGGTSYDNGLFIRQTADGGYICCGDTQSYTHGSPFYCDMLVYRLSPTGQKEWRKNFGGDDCDHAHTVRQTTDGGFILSGETWSYVHGNPNEYADFLLYKLDASGAKLWRKNFGGDHNDYGHDIIQTSDGGYAVTGTSRSYTNGQFDFLVYRLDASGTKLWRKNFGGSNNDEGYIIQQTSDGGFIILGFSYSYQNGEGDMLVYKLDPSGAKLWRKNYGGTGSEYHGDIKQTTDGGYILLGTTTSYSGDGDYDFLLYKLDAAGNKLWRKNFGGAEDDGGHYVWQTSDGGYFLLGDSGSYVHGTMGGDSDLLAYKLDASGAKLWRKNYGGTSEEFTGRGSK